MPGTPLNLTLPTAADTWPTWATKVVNAFTAIENDLEPAVTFNKINANANLELNNYGVVNAKYFGCYANNGTDVPTNSIGVKNNEWFATDGVGRSIQLTLNGGINVSTAGGFVGEYITGLAQAKYTTATTLYEFLTAAGAFYANVRAGNFQIANGANALTLAWAGAASYTATMPPSAPAGVALLTMDAAGVVSVGATVGVGWTQNNANITLTGTADIKHPNRTFTLGAYKLWYLTMGATATSYLTTATVTGGAATAYNSGSSDCTVYLTLPPLKANQRLQSVRMTYNKDIAYSTTWNLYRISGNTTKSAALGTPAVNAGSGDLTATITVTTPTAAVAGDRYVLEYTYVFSNTLDTIMYDVQWVIDNV